MSQVITDKHKINEVLERGVENIYPSKEALKEILQSGKKLRIYNGIDPTGKLHIGHGVVLKKLRQFQDLGHEVIVLIGSFTARIGDPTDKLAVRKKLTEAQIKKNYADYEKLIGKILDTQKSNFKFLYNEEWINKLKPEDMLELASHFTVSRLLERDMFQKRIKESKEIYLHEFLYPIFQAYDSVAMDVDMEIGGNDQTFNMLAGRTLMKKMKNKEKFVLTAKLLVDPTGKKMGKTEGNMVNLDERGENMYGLVMSWPDELIRVGFEICTDVAMDRIKRMEKDMKENKVNPRDLKMELAREIVKIYHGEKKAKEAEEHFVKTIQKKEIPKEIPNYELRIANINIVDLLVETKLASSKSEARRLIQQGGVKVNGETVKDINFQVKLDGNGKIIQKGKRNFAKVKLI
jgi:tyrosyl-tRNA synthetase